jgi:putative membrane protein insertion efficiency factor
VRGLQGGTIGLIRVYQVWVSPLLGPACRFYPSCSEYAVMSIQRQGLRGGGTRALLRILRCTPFQRGGLDLP